MSATIERAAIERQGSNLTLEIHLKCDWCGAEHQTLLGFSLDLWISEGFVPAPVLPSGWTWQREPDADHRSPTNLICDRHAAVRLANWRAGRAHGKRLREEAP